MGSPVGSAAWRVWGSELHGLMTRMETWECTSPHPMEQERTVPPCHTSERGSRSHCPHGDITAPCRCTLVDRGAGQIGLQDTVQSQGQREDPRQHHCSEARPKVARRHPSHTDTDQGRHAQCHTQSQLTLNIFRLFCASCSRLFRAKCILCLFLQGKHRHDFQAGRPHPPWPSPNFQ